MLRYYGKDKTPFCCEEIVERHDVILGKKTRKYENFDELYQSLREGRYDLLEELVEEDEFMVTDINIWICELLVDKDPNLIKHFFESVYRKSYRKDFLVYEAVVFYRNDHHTQTSFKTIDNTELFLHYYNAFLQRMCRWYPEQINRLHACGGIAPVHGVLHLAEFMRSTALDALLSNNADINVKDIHGATLLHHAAWDGYIDNVEMLLERGADKTVRNSDGKTPFDIAMQQSNIKAAKRLRLGKEKIVDTSQRWGKYEEIICEGGPLEFSNHITNIPREPDVSEFIHSLITSKHGGCNPMLAEDVVGKFKAEVNAMMKRIAQLVEGYDSRFAFRPLLTGSVEQGGKVGPPDEFDFSCVLIKFSSLCKEIVEKEHPGYCKLIQRSKLPEEFAEYFENGFLNFSKVNARLFLLIEKALSVIHLHSFQADPTTILIINPPYRQVRLSTVAYKLYLRCNSKELKNLKFKVDLAAVLSYKPFSLKVETFMGIEECLFVHIEDNNVAGVNCRISLTYQENAIFKSFREDNPDIVKSYGLLKTLLSMLSSSWSLPIESEFFAPDATTDGIAKLGLDLIPTTYHIKQSLIKAALDHDGKVPDSHKGREIEFWAKKAVDELVHSYETKQMPTPWLSSHNVMEDHTKRRAPDEPVPENGIDRCFEYLLAHAKILKCILHQENLVDERVVSSDSDSDAVGGASALKQLGDWFV